MQPVRTLSFFFSSRLLYCYSPDEAPLLPSDYGKSCHCLADLCSLINLSSLLSSEQIWHLKMTFVSVIILKDKRVCCAVLLMLVISYLQAGIESVVGSRHMTEFIHLIVERWGFITFFYSVRISRRPCTWIVQRLSCLAVWRLLLL